MSWGEAYRLTTVLLSDPSSHVAAAVAGWDHPVSREWLVLADVYDLTARIAAGKKWTKKNAYPRPIGKRTVRRTKAGAEITQEDIITALRAAGHTAPLPVRSGQ